MRVVRVCGDGSALADAFGWVLNGFLQEPELRPIADEYLNDAGDSAIEELSTMCVADGIFGYSFARSANSTTDGRSLIEIVRAEPLVHDVLDEQRLAPKSPRP